MNLPTRNQGLLFLDSGAFGLKRPAAAWVKQHGKKQADAYYESSEYLGYLDAYARFVQRHRSAIQLYANLDVIYNPDKSWDSLKRLEREYKLTPVPVLHWGTSKEWIKKHLDNYPLIGVGGVAGNATATSESSKSWVDGFWKMVCDTKTKEPRVRVHGFGVTNYKWLIRYPWWSVDSTTWTKVAANGAILLPHTRGGQLRFDINPMTYPVSMTSVGGPGAGTKHARLLAWLELIGVPLGGKKLIKPLAHTRPYNPKMADAAVLHTATERGLINHHSFRKIANLLFFEHARKALPPYPRPFTDADFGQHPESKDKQAPVIIFYSGYGCKESDPEVYLGPHKANIMLTAMDSIAHITKDGALKLFDTSKRPPEKRFRNWYKVHRKKKER